MSNLATWFTPMLKVISRAKGHSATAASAYRACTRITDERTGKVHDYRKKRGHVTTFLFGASDASKLWNDAEKSETRMNSTVGRELILPLAHEWTDKQREDYCREIAKNLQMDYDVAVQCSIHRPIKGLNNHGHFLFSTRTVDKDGVFGKKTRILDDLKTGEVSRLREKVCEIMNKHAKRNGNDWYVYAGKYSDVEVDHIPTVHIPHNTSKERKEELKNQNLDILDIRQKLVALNDEQSDLKDQLAAEIAKEMAEEKLETNPIIKIQQSDSQDSELERRPITPLARAFALRDNAEKMAGHQEKFDENKRQLEGWKRRLKRLEVAPPKYWDPLFNGVNSMLHSMGVKTQEPKRLTEEEWLKEVAKAKLNIRHAEANEKIYLRKLNDPESFASFQEWNRNPNHKAIIEASRCPSPDEIRAKEREQQKDEYKPPPEPEKVTTASTLWDTPFSYPEPKKPWDEPPPY